MNWTQRGQKIGERILKRLNQDPNAGFIFAGRRISMVMATSPTGLDVYEDGGGTSESGTISFSTLKSNFPNKDWPGENAFVLVNGKNYQVMTLSNDKDVAHPWLDYKVQFQP